MVVDGKDGGHDESSIDSMVGFLFLMIVLVIAFAAIASQLASIFAHV